MLRNYLMPGVALVLLAVFSGPRSTPPAPGAALSQPGSSSGRQAANNNEAAQTKAGQLGSKPLFSRSAVCDVTMNEMREKLGEFGLDYSGQTTAAAPSTAGTTGPAAEAMIALVPDPVHTHLALLFDRNVDVIQQALQDRTSEAATGWIYTNQWLPWDPVPYQASQDPVDRTNVHAFDADRECAPGFLLFRRNRFQRNTLGDKFLVVFLVGESPTSGILRQDQFINAMRGWRAIERRDTEEPASTLRILGPSFSASLTTLDTLLLAQNCKAPTADPAACFNQAQVVSGSVAVSRSTIDQTGNFPGLSAANYISMNESSDAVQEMLVNYFSSQQHLTPEEIAFVSEDQTPFGNLLSSMLHPRNSTGRRERPLLFHYPREISQLRNAYEKNSIFSRQSAQQTAAQNQQDLTLSLEDRHEEEDSVPSFSNTQSPVSEESVLSEMTRVMDRQRIRVAVINGTDVLDVIFVAQYLERNVPNVRVVLLNTDLLFERAPDVAKFRGMLLANTYPLIPDNIQWSGRFLHMPGNRPDHPSPFGTFLPDRIFASFETTGIYNAARLLELAPFGPPQPGQGQPGQAEAENHDAAGGVRALHFRATHSRPQWDRSRKFLWLAEYSDPFRGGHHPPLWLSAVGRGGFWPVALLDRYLEDEIPQADASQQDVCVDAPSKTAHDTLPPRSSLVEICAGNAPRVSGDGTIPPRMFDTWWWSPVKFGWTFSRPEATQLLAARLSAVCLLALFILFGLILCVFASVERWPQYVFDIPGTNGERRAWIVLVTILSYSWIARLLILDLPSYRFFRDPLNCGLLFLQLVLLLFAAWLIRTGLSRRGRWLWACLLIALAALGQVLFDLVKPREFAASLFYLYRSQHLFSGVCPVLPFIFLFIAVICLVSRHIHSLLVFSLFYKPRFPSYRNQKSPPLLHFVTRQNVKDMLLACYSPWRMLYSKRQQLRSRRSRLLTALLALTSFMLLLSAYLLFPRGFETFETRSYSILLSFFTVAIVLFMLVEIVWVTLMWICLHKGLLTPLERSTLRACFSRVSGFSWQRLWFSIDLSPAVRYKPLSRAHESVRRMAHDPYCPEEVKRCILDTRTKYADLINAPDSDPVKRVHAFFRFQGALSKCATTVIATILSDPNRQKGELATSLDVSSKEIEDVLTNSAKADSLEANAEEFVGLIYIYGIQHVLLDIRSHILAFTFSYFFLLMALTAYPVAPHHSIMVLLIGLLVAFVIAVVIIFSQMHRDAILSRTTSTEPGKLDIGFYEKLISVLGVPIIGLLASQFPEISNFLFSWLEPSLQTLK
jgi:hypothetical protein